MSKSILILACVYFSLSCTLLNKPSERSPSADDRPIHYVFLIHGLAGKASPKDKKTQIISYSGTFGFMKPAIQSDLERMNKRSRSVVVKEANYNTGSETKTPYDFALDFGVIVNELIRQNSITRKLSPDDKISVVVHSQGGLVATIWYSYSRIAHRQKEVMKSNPELSFDELEKKGFLGEKDFLSWEKYSHLYPMVENIVTLGSPLWGAKTAYAGHLTNNKSLHSTVKSKVGFWEELGALVGDNLWGVANFFSIVKMGRRELEEMSFGSNSIYQFRRRAIWTHKNLGGLPINAVNVGGVVIRSGDIKETSKAAGGKTSKKYLAKMQGAPSNDYSGAGFGYGYFESDLAVLLPSARFDFIYADLTDRKSFSKVKFDDFNHTDFKTKDRPLPFVVTHAIHASKEIETLYDIVATPYKCMPEFREMINKLSHKKNKFLRKKFVNARLIDPDFSEGENLRRSVFPSFEISNRNETDKYSSSWFSNLEIKLRGEWQTDLTEEEVKFAKQLYYYQDEEISLNAKTLSCDHPVYHTVVSNLINCEDADCDQREIRNFYKNGYEQSVKKYQKTRGTGSNLADQMRGFFVDLNLQLPNGYDTSLLGDEYKMQKTLFKELLEFPVEQSTFKNTGELIYNSGATVDDSVRIFVNRPGELLNHRAVVQTIKHKSRVEKHLRIYFTGVVIPKPGAESFMDNFLAKAKSGFPMKFKIKLPGLKHLEVEAKVSPTYSTFLDVEMASLK